MTNDSDREEEESKPSQYGDGGAVACGPGGVPTALLFAGGNGWKTPIEGDQIEDEDQ